MNRNEQTIAPSGQMNRNKEKQPRGQRMELEHNPEKQNAQNKN